jgi:cell wall-associated NlpC family hydrolase
VDEFGARAFAAARAMVGVTFRPQGSEPTTGLDCVGLVWAAYAAAGCRLARPVGYPLRGWSRAQVEAGLVHAGFVPFVGDGREGDVVLVAYPAGQFHLGLMGLDRMVHAHAGLRRVVETPIDDGLRDAVRWRLPSCPPRCD